MRTVDKIIIHCTATPEGRPVTIADVDKWHKERGFVGIGYHYLIGVPLPLVLLLLLCRLLCRLLKRVLRCIRRIGLMQG